MQSGPGTAFFFVAAALMRAADLNRYMAPKKLTFLTASIIVLVLNTIGFSANAGTEDISDRCIECLLVEYEKQTGAELAAKEMLCEYVTGPNTEMPKNCVYIQELKEVMTLDPRSEATKSVQDGEFVFVQVGSGLVPMVPGLSTDRERYCVKREYETAYLSLLDGSNQHLGKHRLNVDIIVFAEIFNRAVKRALTESGNYVCAI